MPLDPKLLEILACPNCRGDVEYLPDQDVIECRGQCRYRYPVKDDIPVMLVDEAVRPEVQS